MFFRYDDRSVRFTGRFGIYGDAMAATAPGSKIEIAFSGSLLVLHFDMAWNSAPLPHLWISADSATKFEVPLDRYLRVEFDNPGEHTVTVIFKGAVEMQHRWHSPLIGKVAFRGYEADAAGTLAPCTKKRIEFVGDSITEGVLVDAMYNPDKNDDQFNRPYQDDSTATYAYLTARALGMEPSFMAYGAIGVTHGGCGGTPSSVEGYPCCFDGVSAPAQNFDAVVINLGTNDCGNEWKAQFAGQYLRLLDLIRAANPAAKIVAMVPFCGAFHDELLAMIPEYNREHGDHIMTVDTAGWLPFKPIHPLRDGHKIAAGHLTAALKELL